MTKVKSLLLLAVFMLATIGASAQFRFGPRVGIEVNSLHFNEKVFESNNRAGFTGGLQAEFTVPLIGIGGDIAVMYVHRTSKWIAEQEESDLIKSDYIEIPLNFKYKVNIPMINHIIRPYLFTGPSFAILCSKKAVSEFLQQKACDVAWNFGIGVELIRHLQIGASYGLGMTKAFQALDLTGQSMDISCKNNYWTITAAWLF